MMFMWISTLISPAWLAWSSQAIRRYIIVDVRVRIPGCRLIYLWSDANGSRCQSWRVINPASRRLSDPSQPHAGVTRPRHPPWKAFSEQGIKVEAAGITGGFQHNVPAVSFEGVP
ncbi:hypothetical protein FOXYSP1_00599 [Fusarium oxysporum f. sp. phaseoli]|jgi:hypothetical protein